jgi:hypothetical protein
MSNNQTLEFDDIAKKDSVACAISTLFQSYESLRNEWIVEKKEIQQYIFATDTTKTTNSQLPWKNKTTIPKLCQIRDNLYANYWAALFPKRKWLNWESDNQEDQKVEKSRLIEAYMSNIMDRPEFKTELSKMVYDFIDYGNVYATARWVDQTHTASFKQQVGYVGPLPQRISPIDIYFNLAATDFNQTPKIIRSLMTLGDFAKILSAESGGEDKETYKEIMEYMSSVRTTVAGWTGSVIVKDAVYNVSGFGTFADYLKSNFVEVLTLVGDFYDIEKGVLHKNKKITVVDRTRLVSITDSSSMLSGDGIYHAAWRIRQDSLLGMGPLDNLVGMQYRIDHLENLKADVFDLIAAPPLKIKGLVDDFTWGPFARINVGDDGDVSVLAPDVNALNANLEITNLENKMEEMAGSPKEAMGFRTPGEKTMYEVQRLENASARIFATKVKQFEEQIVEPLFNAMLDLAIRYLDSAQIRVIDETLDVPLFQTISKEDLVGSGRIRPMAARNFAERAELVQNLNSFFQSTLGQDPEMKAHFSTVKLARMFENLLDIESFGVITPYVRISEQQEASKLTNAGEEDVQMEATTASGLTPDDADIGLPV